ncbi:MAG: hypothetical protein ACKVVT_18460, partial [Dehalococcoidia bacterium]
MELTFNGAMSDDVLSVGAYEISELADTSKKLSISNIAFVGTERKVVALTTSPQAGVIYAITKLEVKNVEGIALTLSSPSNQFQGNASPPAGTPADNGAPRVVGAASLNNTQVIVAFSEPMAENAIKPEHYVIVQENVNPESGFLRVSAASFYEGNRSTVLLTTSSQNELTYRVTVVNATDLSGIALSPKIVNNGVLVDPTSVLFPGTPPVDSQVDSDGDGLSDNKEMRGWIVTIHLLDGTTSARGSTSDPASADSDGEGLGDAQEANLRFDARDPDSDDDQLSDYAEFNEIYSNGLDQDSDNDTLDDFLEFTFFFTSPLFADTDGDQIKDGDEVIGSRNPRVADLPRPEISVGSVNLQLDVEFSETKDDQRRELETKSIASTLTQSSRQTHTRSDTV